MKGKDEKEKEAEVKVGSLVVGELWHGRHPDVWAESRENGHAGGSYGVMC